MDAENTMLKTKAAYYQRCQQGVKLREELTTAQALLTYMQDHGIQESNTIFILVSYSKHLILILINFMLCFHFYKPLLKV